MMNRARIAALCVSAVLATVVPFAGAATTFDVLQQNSSVFDNGTTNDYVVGQINTPRGNKQKVGTYGIGGFHLKSRPSGTNSAYQTFMAFCVEITVNLTTKATKAVTYTEAPELFSGVRRALMATLFAEAFDPGKDKTHQAAFQLALWKLTYGDISTSSGDAFDVTARSSAMLNKGYVSFTEDAKGKALKKTFDVSAAGTFAKAQTWLNALNGDGVGDWRRRKDTDGRLTFLQTGKSQNLAVYIPGPDPGPAPIPLPLPAALLGGALGGLGLLRWRRGHRAPA